MLKICENCGEYFIIKERNKYLYHLKYCSKECLIKMTKFRSIERQKENRKISKEIGNCTSCHKERDSQKYLHCNKCRNYRRTSYHKNKLKMNIK